MLSWLYGSQQQPNCVFCWPWVGSSAARCGGGFLKTSTAYFSLALDLQRGIEESVVFFSFLVFGSLCFCLVFALNLEQTTIPQPESVEGCCRMEARGEQDSTTEVDTKKWELHTQSEHLLQYLNRSP